MGKAYWKLAPPGHRGGKGTRESDGRTAARRGLRLVGVVHEARTYGPSGNQREAERLFDKASPPSAKYGLVCTVKPPGEAEAWTKVFLVGIAQSLRNSGLGGGDDRRWGNGRGKVRRGVAQCFLVRYHDRAGNSIHVVTGQEGGRVVVGVFERRMQLVTQTEIQCEPGGNFPIILGKETIALAPAIHGRMIYLFGKAV